LYSFGTNNNTDRSLGSAGNGAASSYGVLLQNNTPNTLNSFTVQYAMEMWHRGSGKNDVQIDVAYKINETSLSATGYTDVASNILDAGGGGAAALDGNLAANRNVLTFIISGISVAPGDKIMLRWTDNTPSGFNLGIDDVSITPSASASAATVYYSKPIPKNGSPVYLNNLSSWTTKADGTGTVATSFSNATFIITNQSAPTLNANWVLGTNAKAVVSDGNFVVPSTYSFQGKIDVMDYATLTLQNTILPQLGVLSDLSTVNYNGSGTVTLPDAEYGTLSIGSGNKKLSVKTRIKKNLNLNNSKLELDNYDLIMDEGATITGANSTGFISTKGNGKLKMKVKNDNTAVVFPVGTDVYLPVIIKQAPGATADTFSVKAIDGIYTNYTNNVPGSQLLSTYAINKTWIIDEGVVGGSDVTITLSWNSTDVSPAGFNPKTAWISHYTGGEWDNTTPSQATLTNGVYSLSRSGITSFSPFSGQSGAPDPLPVELISFQASRNESGINCQWATATEKNNSHFTIERSANGEEFFAIGEVKGQGTTSQQTNYTFTDLKPVAGNAYYRLRQVDLDGTFTFSKTIVVKAASNKHEAFTLYPNPGNGVQYIKPAAGSAQAIQINVRNLQGELIQTAMVKNLDSSVGYKLDLTAQPKGLYLIEVVSEKDSFILKAVNQ
jgi:hypothetical protein